MINHQAVSTFYSPSLKGQKASRIQIVYQFTHSLIHVQLCTDMLHAHSILIPLDQMGDASKKLGLLVQLRVAHLI